MQNYLLLLAIPAFVALAARFSGQIVRLWEGLNAMAAEYNNQYSDDDHSRAAENKGD